MGGQSNSPGARSACSIPNPAFVGGGERGGTTTGGGGKDVKPEGS